MHKAILGAASALVLASPAGWALRSWPMMSAGGGKADVTAAPPGPLVVPAVVFRIIRLD